MDRSELDVVAVGSAIVDVLTTATDDDLEARGLVKGTMALMDAAAADRLYAGMGPGVEVSGGSAANTVAGVASFGGSAAFITTSGRWGSSSPPRPPHRARPRPAASSSSPPTPSAP